MNSYGCPNSIQTNIVQTIPTTPATYYTLSFIYSGFPGRQDNRVGVYWNGIRVGEQLSADGTGSTTNWQTYTYQVLATSTSSILTFSDESANDDATGGFIDHVTLAPLMSANLVYNGILKLLPLRMGRNRSILRRIGFQR